MLLAGDEIGRTQQGNNNAYCQDNEISWVDWENADAGLLDFVRALSWLRRSHPVFRRRRFFQGRSGGGPADIAWLTPSGTEMTDDDWRPPYAKALAVFVNGQAISEPGPRGQHIVDQSFLLLFNAHSEEVTFTLPGRRLSESWDVVIDTSADPAPGDGTGRAQAEITEFAASSKVKVAGRSVQILRGPVPEGAEEGPAMPPQFSAGLRWSP
jgi:glycogen operon protein